MPRFVSVDLPIFASLLIAASAVLSLVAIIAIYREGGILKRLRATPLRPHTILTAHVLVKLLFTAVTLAVMVLAGRRYYPVGADVPLVSFTLALLFSTVSILSLGFLIASVVPTARFAQPIGTLILYPMLGLSGLFVPVDSLPPLLQAIARVLPSPTRYRCSEASGAARVVRPCGDVAMLAVCSWCSPPCLGQGVSLGVEPESAEVASPHLSPETCAPSQAVGGPLQALERQPLRRRLREPVVPSRLRGRRASGRGSRSAAGSGPALNRP